MRVAGSRENDEAVTVASDDIRGDMRGLREETNGLGAGLRAEIGGLRAEVRTDIQRLDHKIDRMFMWMVGMIVDVLSALGGLAFQISRL